MRHSVSVTVFCVVGSGEGLRSCEKPIWPSFNRDNSLSDSLQHKRTRSVLNTDSLAIVAAMDRLPVAVNDGHGPASSMVPVSVKLFPASMNGPPKGPVMKPEVAVYSPANESAFTNGVMVQGSPPGQSE